MRAKKMPDAVSSVAVIYARYSSHAQREVSIEQQIKECTQYAQRNGLKISAVYADKAISGKTDLRPQFQKMINDAAKGGFRCVIAWKSNRMGRNMMQAMVNEARLNDLGVRCLYVEEDFDDTAAGRFALRNMMNVNQFYSDNLAEDVMRGMMDNAAKCMVNGPCPFQRFPLAVLIPLAFKSLAISTNRYPQLTRSKISRTTLAPASSIALKNRKNEYLNWCPVFLIRKMRCKDAEGIL